MKKLFESFTEFLERLKSQTYENHSILEVNKAVEYFRNNPQALSNYSQGVSAHKNKWDPKIDNSIEVKRAKQVKDQVYKKFKRLGDIDVPFADFKNSWSIGEILLGVKDGFSSWVEWELFAEGIIKAKNIDMFIDESKNRNWTFPLENYSNKKNISQYENLYLFIKTNWNEVQKSFKWLMKALEGIKGSAEKGFENDILALGLSIKDVEIAMSYIKDWTSKSGKKLDPQVWSLLQKISVSDNLLPKYVYRGIFYDGAKIKDEAKWLKKWYPSAKPEVSQGKATSWSVDRGTAISFMTDQDFVKDVNGGYYMLLKWEVDSKNVICDLRNLPVDHIFWNQQEIIVSPEAKDYEIDVMIPGKEGYEAYKKFCVENPGGQGVGGQTKTQTLAKSILRPYDKFTVGDRMEMKRVAKMTVNEFQKEYQIQIVSENPAYENMAIPLWNYIEQHFWNCIILRSTNNEVNFQLKYTTTDLEYPSEFKSILQNIKNKHPYQTYYGKDAIVSNEGSIKLLNDDYYNIVIEVTMPTHFEIVTGAKGDNTWKPSADDNATDAALKKLFDEVGGSKFFVQWSKNKEVNKKQLSKNVNIQLK